MPGDCFLHVVVCTYNRAHLIESTLDSLAEQTAVHDGRWSVLVVDNNCTDNTVAVVERYRDRLPKSCPRRVRG